MIYFAAYKITSAALASGIVSNRTLRTSSTITRRSSKGGQPKLDLSSVPCEPWWIMGNRHRILMGRNKNK